MSAAVLDNITWNALKSDFASLEMVRVVSRA
jgi:hypothetical protein